VTRQFFDIEKRGTQGEKMLVVRYANYCTELDFYGWYKSSKAGIEQRMLEE